MLHDFSQIRSSKFDESKISHSEIQHLRRMHETRRTKMNLSRDQKLIRIYTRRRERNQKQHANSEGRMLTTYRFKPCMLRTQIYVGGQTNSGVWQAILTWPTDVLNLQVFVGGRACVAKETVRRQDATLGPVVASRQTWRNAAHVPRHGNKDNSPYLFFAATVVTIRPSLQVVCLCVTLVPCC